MRRRVATSAWRAADVTRRGSDVAAATRVARALQRVGASRAASTSSGSGPSAFDWDDDDEVGSLRSKVRRALAASRARPDDRAASGASASSSAAPKSLGWFGADRRPAPWDVSLKIKNSVAGGGGGAPPAYDPKAFTEYFLYRRPFRALMRTTEILLRLSDVGARVVLRRGAVEDRAARLRAHFAVLGPAFVKLGQVLSTRADFLPPSYCRELTKLQENLEPITHEHAEVTLSEELDIVTTNEVFAGGLPRTPVAAASLAAVYKANLAARPDGPAVAVKVQRPGLAESVALDATILRGIALVLREVFGLRSDVVGIVDELVGRIFGELDYRAERLAVERFRATYALGGGSGPDLAGKVRAPRVIPELSTDRVLVMEWINGVRLSDAEGVRSSAKNVLLERGVRCSLHQLLETGFMHADPHPGNLVVDANTGALTYLDFGMTVTVDARRRSAMLRGLVGFVNRDARSLVRDLVELEFLPRDVDQTRAAYALTEVFDGVARETNTKAVRGTNDFLGVVSQLGSALYAFEFRLPPYFARILRALAALEGVATGVDPEFRVIERVYPYVLARLVRDPDPETRETLRRLVLTPDGESVRWRRVARVFSAVAESLKNGNGNHSAETRFGTEGDETKEKNTRAVRDVCETFRKVAETARAVAEGADELVRARARASVREDETERESERESESERAAAMASAARDAMEYVMSPAGTGLRAALVRDALDACDALCLEDETVPIPNTETASGSETAAASDAADAADAADATSALAFAEAAREAYVAAPRAWAPVLAEAAEKRGTAEMSLAFGRGVAQRVTRENARRAAKAALKALEKAL